MQKKMKVRRVSKRSALLLGTALVGGSLAMVLAPGGAYAACSGLSTGSASCNGVIAGPVNHSPTDDSTITIVSVPATTITSAAGSFGLYVNPTVGGTQQIIDVQSAATINTATGDVVRFRVNGAGTLTADVNMTINGDLNATGNAEGVDMSVGGGTLVVNVGADSDINVGGDGISVSNGGTNGNGINSHSISITANGDVLADSRGIYSAQSGTGTNTVVNNGNLGTSLDRVGTNPGAGKGDQGIHATIANWGTNGQGLSVSNNGSIYSVGNGIQASSSGTADVIVNLGSVSDTSHIIDSLNGAGVVATATSSGDVSVTGRGDGTGASAIFAGTDGIHAEATTGNVTIDIQGIEIGSLADEVGDDGVEASTTSGNISVTHFGNSIYAAGDGLTTTTATGAITIVNGDGSAANADGFIDAGGSAIVANITGAGATSAIDIKSNGELIAGVNGISATNAGTSATSDILIETGAFSDITAGADGIIATASGGDITMTIRGSVESLTDDAVQATAVGSGTINLTVYGDLNDGGSNGDSGIQANGVDGNVTITTGLFSDITAGQHGIEARTTGTGGIDIEVRGDVTTGVNTGAGIFAQTSGSSTGIEITTGLFSDIESAGYGIQAVSTGATGGVTVTTRGDVSGFFDGIRAEIQEPDNTADINITVGLFSNVESADDDGIDARNAGSGNINISLYGDVFSGNTNDTGVEANATGGGNIDIDTYRFSEIQGVTHGIDARANGGTGEDGTISLTLWGDINASGTGTGATGSAVYAESVNGDISITTGFTSDITAASADGIFATSVAGDVGVTNYGAIGGFDIGNLAFETVGNNGIDANVTGGGASGADVIVQNYNLVAASAIGIDAYNNAAADTVPDPDNLPLTSVTNRGVVFGEETGVRVTSTNGGGYVGNYGLLFGGDWDGGAAVEFNTAEGGFLYNEGLIASADSVSDFLFELNANPPTSTFDFIGDLIDAVQDGADDLAVLGTAGEVTVVNDGIIIGRVSLTDTDGWNDVYNNGLWVTKGTNLVNGDVDNDGWIQTAVGTAWDEFTEFTGVRDGTWVNNGVVSMLDGEEGDWTAIRGTDTAPGVRFTAEEDSVLVVDSYLGAPGSLSDVLQIGSELAGGGGTAVVDGDYSTRVFLNDTNSGVGAYNPDGILVVSLPGGTYASDAFVLSEANAGYDPTYQVIDKGLFDYALIDIPEGPEGDGFYLVGLPGVEAYQLPSLITGAQSIWHDTTGVWLDRQADLRSYLANPVEVAPATTIVSKEKGLITKAPPAVASPSITPGVWGKALGSWASRDANKTYSIAGNDYTYDTGYDQDTYGFIAGADFGKTTGDSAWVFGVLGGYINSKMDFNTAGTSAEYTGGTVGGYVTYLSGGFFIDGLVKADFLSLDYDAPSLLGIGYTGESSDVTNIGFTVDTGYRFAWTGSVWFEPVATLSYVNTQIDDLTGIEDTTVQFQDGDSLRGALGARIGGKVFDGAAYWVEASATGRFWYEFEGNNQAWILNPGDDFAATDNFDGGFGEITGSLNVFGKGNGWNGFLNGSYLFNDDYNSGSAKVGVRYQW